MKIPVEELFLQVEREVEFQNRYEQGFDEGKLEGKEEGKDEVILNMLDEKFDFNTIQRVVGCSKEHIQKLSNKHVASK